MKNLKIYLIVFSLLITTSIAFSDSLLDDFRNRSSKDYQKIKVIRVISAERIELRNREKIKLIGLKAPPVPKKKKVIRDKNNFVIEDTSPFITMEEKAFNFAKALLENKFVRIEFDKQKKAEDFSTLAYVFLVEDNSLVNAEILRQGYANLQIRPPNTKYADDLRSAYKEARKEKRGLQGD